MLQWRLMQTVSRVVSSACIVYTRSYQSWKWLVKRRCLNLHNHVWSETSQVDRSPLRWQLLKWRFATKVDVISQWQLK